MGTRATKGKAGGKPARDLSSLPAGTEALLDKRDVCLALKIGERKFAEMRAAGEFPAPDLRIGNLPRWRPGTLNAWIERRAAGGS
jgi:predicted DNA-binding transcriptional regulator AlpA